MALVIVSYGHKNKWAKHVDQFGPPTLDALVLEKNPADVKGLLALRGWDDKVLTHVLNQRGVAEVLAQGWEILLEHGLVKVRCRSGHHRSVAIAELLGNWARRRLSRPVAVVHLSCLVEGRVGQPYSFGELWGAVRRCPMELPSVCFEVNGWDRASLLTIGAPTGLHLSIDDQGVAGLFPEQMDSLRAVWESTQLAQDPGPQPFSCSAAGSEQSSVDQQQRTKAEQLEQSESEQSKRQQTKAEQWEAEQWEELESEQSEPKVEQSEPKLEQSEPQWSESEEEHQRSEPSLGHQQTEPAGQLQQSKQPRVWPNPKPP